MGLKGIVAFLCMSVILGCASQQMKLTSSAFEEGEEIPERYTCDGADVNPPLKIMDIPAETKSLALIVDDPDAPGKVWVHWVVWEIPPEMKKIAEGSILGVQGLNDFKRKDYSGPCPPSGTHRYFFKVYALSIVPDMKENAGKEELEKAMQGHIIAEARLMGTYQRK